MRSSNDVSSINWHPLTRDGGATLSRQFKLIDLTAKQSGNMLKWHSFETDRETQFGDVPDSFSEAHQDSIFSLARKDLSDLSRVAHTPDFWRSMLMIGGVSLASSIADKPVDKFAVRHGNNSSMKRVESIGNALPIAAAAYSGFVYLSNDQDNKLARASYSSLAAGGVGLLGATGLKYMVGRARPNLDLGASQFTPMSKNNSNTSWPSGHTTIMWATITPYAKAYDAPWLYGVATLTNVARIGGRNHWLSDTVAGSLLGYAIGDFMWDTHKNKKHGTELSVTPNGVTAYWKIE